MIRISTLHTFQSGVDAMQRAQVALNKTNLQLSSGRRILTPSDDPSGATQASQLRSAIDSTQQYQRNLDLAQPRLRQQESAIASITDQLQRVRELMIYGNNETQTNETRGFMANEIRDIRDSLFEIANTKDPNGEYLFGGTRSLVAPFVMDADGVVTYVGAQGDGAVREVAVTPTRKIAIGDTGAKVFMDMKENDGRVSADIQRGPDLPLGTLVIERTEVSQPDEFYSGNNAAAQFEIRFQRDADGQLQYQVAGLTDWNDYHPEQTNRIEFAGRSVYLSGEPNVADTVISRPARAVDLFTTLDTVATALERGTGSASSRANLINAFNKGIADLDAATGHLNDIRASIGMRLQVVDNQTDFNQERILDLRTTLSAIEDLDYAEAISDFKFQQVALQASQQAYVQVNRLSLFNFL